MTLNTAQALLLFFKLGKMFSLTEKKYEPEFGPALYFKS